MTTPFFSVIIPTYNRALTVRDAIRSVLSDAFSDFEILVVDDGSTDDTLQQLALEIDPRVRVFAQPNAGVSAARNWGAALSTGKYLVFLDSDDRLSLHLLQYFHLALTSGIKWLGFGTVKYIDHGHVIRSVEPWALPGNFGPQFPGAFAIDRFLFEQSGGYDPLLRYAENSELFLRIQSIAALTVDRVALISDAGVIKRVEEQRQRNHRYSMIKLDSVAHFLKKHTTYFNNHPEAHLNFMNIYAQCAYENGRYALTRQILFALIRRHPYRVKPYLRCMIFLFRYFVGKKHNVNGES